MKPKLIKQIVVVLHRILRENLVIKRNIENAKMENENCANISMKKSVVHHPRSLDEMCSLYIMQ